MFQTSICVYKKLGIFFVNPMNIVLVPYNKCNYGENQCAVVALFWL